MQQDQQPEQSTNENVEVKQLELEIASEEKFTDVKRKDDNAVYIEYTKENVLNYIKNYTQATMPERLSYTNHLIDIFFVGDEEVLKAFRSTVFQIV